MKITAEKINGNWCTTINGKSVREYGPNTQDLLKAINHAAELRLPAKQIKVQAGMFETIENLKMKFRSLFK